MALTVKRKTRPVKFSAIDHVAGKIEQVYQGGRACIDTSTGLIAKAFASTTLVPIGVYVEDQLTVSGQTVLVDLDKETTARWYLNSTAGDLIAVAQIGSDCYLVDDNTVAKTSNSGARSVAGRVWRIDTIKGVLVEPHG